MSFPKAPLAVLIGQLFCWPALAQVTQTDAPPAPSAAAAPASATAADKQATSGAQTLPAVTVRARANHESTVLDARTLEQEPPKDIRALFDNVIGVNFSETGNGQLGDIEIRGMGGMGSSLGSGSNRVTVQVDGMDITQGFSFGHSMRNGRQYFDAADLKAVEIRKGPGASGLAGNVQFRTKDPADYLRDGQRTGGEVRTGYSGDTRDGSLGATVASRFSDTSSALLSYTHHRFHELDNQGGLDVNGPQRTKRNPLDGDSHSLNAKWLIQPNAQHRLTLAAQHFSSDWDTDRRSQLGRSRLYDTHLSLSEQKTRRDALSLTHESTQATPAFDSVQWQISAQKTASEGLDTQDRTTLSSNRRAVRYDRNEFKAQIYTLRADMDKRLGGAASGVQQDLRYGFKLQNSHLEQTSTLSSGTASADRTFFPKNAQWNLRLHASDRIEWLGSGISVTPSLGLSHISVTPKMPAGVAAKPGTEKYSKTAPDLGLMIEWQPDESQLLSARYNHATRLPAYGETNGQSYGHWLGRPNPLLKPETADALELAYSSAGAYGHQKTTLFYNRYKNLIDVKCDDVLNGSGYCTVYNLPGNSRFYGLEFEGTLKLESLGAPRGLTLKTGFIYTRGKSDNRYAERRADPFNGLLALQYEAPSNTWGATARLKFSRGKSADDLPRGYHGTPGYGVLDLLAHYKPTRQLTISGGIYNAGDKQYVRWSRFRDVATSPTYVPYTESGRYVGVNLRYQF